jgi:hypothetical protein
MTPFLRVAATVGLLLHGLVHLLGTAVYLRLAKVPGFPYKTTLLGGQWDLGPTGIRVVGVLWGGAALGFVVAAVAFWQDWSAWRTILMGVTLVSLMLTMLDWTVAYAGVVVNVVILAMLVLAPRL